MHHIFPHPDRAQVTTGNAGRNKATVSAHKKNIMTTICAIIITTLPSCVNSDKLPSGEPVEILRLDHKLETFGKMTTDEANDFITQNTDLLQVQTAISGESNVDSASVAAQAHIAQAFAKATNASFPNLNALQQALGTILVRAKNQGITLPQRTYAATIWSNTTQTMALTDKVMLVALNHYLGPAHEAYNGMPEYRRALKRPEMIPYDMAEALVAQAMPFKSQGAPTVLSRLLYEGALIQAKMTLVDDANEADAMGFTQKQLTDIAANRKMIWERLVSDNLLYSTDAAIAHQLFDLLPSTNMISPDAPGRAVRLTGYEIVRAYLEKNPDTTVAQLLDSRFYNSPQTLKEAGYTPR